jgi:glycosyltransferase involved in cell wall biosynthesis
MNILYIDHYAGSPKMGMEYRPFYMAREWAKQGHHSTIVAASFAHLRTVQPEVNEIFKKAPHLGVEYLFVKTREYSGNDLNRVRNMWGFVKALSRSAKTIAEAYKPDVVIASSTYPLDIYPARKIARYAGAKLIFEVHDLWPLSAMELGGYKKWHPFIIILQRAENYAYRYADKVVSILPCTLEHMKAHGLDEKKFHYIPNGIVKEEWESSELLPDSHSAELDRIRKKFPFLVGYVGSHGLANALYSFIDAADRMKENGKVCFVLTGKGPEKENLQKKAKELAPGNVFFLDPVPKKAVPELLKRMDFLYIGLKNESLYRFGISPNKLFDYMMAGKPVIQAINAGNDMVKEADCGISVESENPKQIVNAVCRLISLSPEERMNMGQGGYNYVNKTHTYSILAEKFIEVFYS